MLTPEGSKAIEDFVPGDFVLSRSEDDPKGEICPKVVEEVFVRLGSVWHLHVGGQVIRTTGEHPLYVEGKDWTAARDLVQGDVLVSHDGQRVVVEEIFDTGEFETVYNLRVADWHTYFTTGLGWGFSVWAHNQSCENARALQEYVTDPRKREFALRALNRGPDGDSKFIAYLMTQLGPGQNLSEDAAQEALTAIRTPPSVRRHYRGTEYPHDFDQGVRADVIRAHTAMSGPMTGLVLTRDGEYIRPSEASIEHIESVVQHWNRIGYNTDRQTRKIWYNNKHNLTVLRKGVNSSEGATKQAQDGGTMRQDTGPQYSLR